MAPNIHNQSYPIKKKMDQDIQNFGPINSRSAAEPWLASFWMRRENSSAW